VVIDVSGTVIQSIEGNRDMICGKINLVAISLRNKKNELYQRLPEEV